MITSYNTCIVSSKAHTICYTESKRDSKLIHLAGSLENSHQHIQDPNYETAFIITIQCNKTTKHNCKIKTLSPTQLVNELITIELNDKIHVGEVEYNIQFDPKTGAFYRFDHYITLKPVKERAVKKYLKNLLAAEIAHIL